MNKIKVLFFATLKEYTGTRQLELVVPADADIRLVKDHLAAVYPSVKPLLETCIVSINHEFALDDEQLPSEAEIAFFPPVSGGSEKSFPTIYKITEDVLDLDELVAQVTLPSTGAACVFTGMVRGVTSRGDAHQTSYLEYEAYVPMAEAKMAQVAEEIRERWPVVEGIAIVQRIGRLDPGTPTVLIACSAAHRDTGVFDAARYGIDRLKEIVPVWKKEVGPDGEAWVEGKYLPKAGE
ncbi:MAG TPA: molybdenum cofactor biosynthesis protein MoaE [Anaerolineales bacterium]|nr:molybdenum cofactor biosynthesis protein MoaE [Anaerolineales bacterium]